MNDILIVGRGLAGVTLSFELISRGIPHKIIDARNLSSSSKVAAGLVNPIVLKRLKMVQDADVFMENISDFYKNLEQLTNASFYTEIDLHHIFASTGEINLWEEKKDIPFHAQYLKGIVKTAPENIIAPHGLGLMKNIGWLDTQAYLKAHASYCSQNSIPIENRSLSKNELETITQTGTTVVLCTGHLLRHWDLVPFEVFSPTRGEVMTIEAPDLSQANILHSSIFAIPLGNNQFKIGATYHWDNLNDSTTIEALDRLKLDLEKIYSGPYKILEHQAGVRPNTKDRKPLIGKLDDNLMVFNGMGSRAALMTPYLSKVFCDYLINQTTLPPTYDIQRFK